jgi:hypothetical protein
MKFRRYRFTSDDLRESIGNPADIFEYIKPQVQEILKQSREILTRKDESDLFNIANNFGFRHLNQRQKLAMITIFG